MTRDEVITLAKLHSSQAKLPFNGQWIFSYQKEILAFADAIEARVLDKARISIGAMIRMGELPEPQHSERNGLVLAYNAIQAMKDNHEKEKSRD